MFEEAKIAPSPDPWFVRLPIGHHIQFKFPFNETFVSDIQKDAVLFAFLEVTVDMGKSLPSENRDMNSDGGIEGLGVLIDSPFDLQMLLHRE